MFGWLKRNADRRTVGHELFGRIVTQARIPEFYRDFKVADTMEGRFEMIVLHVALVLRRLKREGVAGQRLGQAVMEALVATMDDALRQIGIGDMGVPRRIQKTAAALIERTRDYEAGLAEDNSDEKLASALSQHIYGNPPDASTLIHAAALARYIRASDMLLATVPADALFSGRITFAPVPALSI
jgi:cytochrome b pre-mRNA-processing protein 3